ncbi:MAG: TolB family protein [Terriglobales bacterium]
MQRRWGCKLLFLLFLSSAAAGAQKTSGDAVMDQVFAVRRFRQTAISPDGKSVAWVERLTTPDGTVTGNAGIYVARLGDRSAPKRISAAAGPHREDDIAWSPDSAKLAFLSDAEAAGQLQIYVADITSGSSRQLTHLKGDLSAPRWSPDGNMLALLFIADAPRAAGPLVAMEPAVGVIEGKIYEQRLTIVNAAGGEPRQVSPPDMYVYEYDWSPDGKEFAATAAHGSGDNNWWIAQLYTLRATGGEMKSILRPPLQISMPRW